MVLMAIGALGMIISGTALYEFYSEGEEARLPANSEPEVQYVCIEQISFDTLMEPLEGETTVSENESITTSDEETTAADSEETTAEGITTSAELESMQGQIDKSASDTDVVNDIGDAASSAKKPTKNKNNKDNNKNEKTEKETASNKEQKTTVQPTAKAQEVQEETRAENTKNKSKKKKSKTNIVVDNPFVSVILPDGYETDKKLNVIIFIISAMMFVGSGIGLLYVSKEPSKKYSKKTGAIESIKLAVASRVDFAREKILRMVKGDESVDKWRRKTLLSDDPWLDIKDEDASKEKARFLEDERERREAFLVEEEVEKNAFIAEVTAAKATSKKSKDTHPKEDKKKNEDVVVTESVSRPTEAFLVDDSDKKKKRNPFLGIGMLKAKTDIDQETMEYMMNNHEDEPFLVDDTTPFLAEDTENQKELFLVDEAQEDTDYEEVDESEMSEESRKKVESLLAQMKAADAKTVQKASDEVAPVQDATAESESAKVVKESFIVDDKSSDMIELVEEDLATAKVSNSAKKMMKKKKKHKK